MTFIVDASVALKWVIDEPGTGAATRLFGQSLSAPDFIYLECANALWKLEQRREATVEQVIFKLAALRAIPLKVLATADLIERALEIGCRLKHPIYDCIYLAAAEITGCAVVTVDERLLRGVGADATLAQLAISLQEAAAN
jgi:predicted nucleic acid-binding protein